MNTPVSASVDGGASDTVVGQSRVNADRLLGVVLLAHLPVSLIIAAMFGGWTLPLAIAAPLSVGVFWLTRERAGALSTRLTIGLALMIYSALFIQQTHGLIEMHFHIFASLALLLSYRDWRVPALAAAAIAVHHVVFFMLQQAGVGVSVMNHGGGFGMIAVHAAFVVFETSILVLMAHQLEQEAIQTQAVFTSLEALGQGSLDNAPGGDGVAAALRTVIAALRGLESCAAELSTSVNEQRVAHFANAHQLHGAFGVVASRMREASERVEALRAENDRTSANTHRFLAEELGPAIVAMKEGDLTSTIATGFGGEYDATARAMNLALSQLRDALRDLRESSEQIDGASTDIADGSAVLAKLTSSQTRNLAQITTSLHELASLETLLLPQVHVFDEEDVSTSEKIWLEHPFGVGADRIPGVAEQYPRRPAPSVLRHGEQLCFVGA